MTDTYNYKIKYKPSDMPFIDEITVEYFIDPSIDLTTKKVVEIINSENSPFINTPITESDIIEIKKIE